MNIFYPRERDLFFQIEIGKLFPYFLGSRLSERHKLTFSQGLEPRKRVLTVYEAVVRKEGCTDFREIHRLRDAVERRAMSDAFGPAEEEIWEEHVEYIVVDKKRLIFHFKCGLWLDE